MMKEVYNSILDYLPYKSSFRFVDQLTVVTGNEVRGSYTLTGNEFFYKDHFRDNPITPGVILTEIMAQIGLVVMGIYLSIDSGKQASDLSEGTIPLMTSSDVSFYKIVRPGQRVDIVSRKKYFRLGKLKCEVEMLDEKQEVIAKGVFSGIMASVNKNL